MRITSKLLKRKRACREQVALFEKLFPNGVEVTEAICVAHADKFNFHWAAENLLSASAWAEYKRVKDSVQAEYQRNLDAAWAEYQRIVAPTGAEYERAVAASWPEYRRNIAVAFARAANLPTK
jgi:hypothetical protein